MVTTRATRRASAEAVEHQSLPRARNPADRAPEPASRIHGGFALTTLLAGVVAIASPMAVAQTWRIEPAVSIESTLTDNVDLASSGQRRGDWVNQLTPSVRFSEKGAHTNLSGNISLPILLYARTSENDYVAPQANVTGKLEAIERFFFIDATANVSQQYQSPFGARSISLANATGNRYTAQAYTLSPYIRGTPRDDVSYELRQQSIWSDAAG